MTENNIGIIGSGGHAREVATYTDFKVAFHAVSKEYLADSLTDIENPTNEQMLCPVVAAVGSPLIRREMIERWPGERYVNVICPRSYIDKSVTMGSGVQIAPQAVVMTGSKLGNHVIINISSTISHDCELADYVTISPGVNIGGKAKLGSGVFVGIGATISNNITIASGCVVGAGTLVLGDVLEENSVIVGVPGKVIKRNEGWLREV